MRILPQRGGSCGTQTDIPNISGRDPSLAPSPTRAIIVSLTIAVNHPVGLAKRTVDILIWCSMGNGRDWSRRPETSYSQLNVFSSSSADIRATGARAWPALEEQATHGHAPNGPARQRGRSSRFQRDTGVDAWNGIDVQNGGRPDGRATGKVRTGIGEVEEGSCNGCAPLTCEADRP